MKYPEKKPEQDDFTVKENKESYDSGYRLIYKSTIKHGYIGFEKPFKRSEAWLWLILNAWGNPNARGEITIGEKVFILEYGEMVFSLRFMASAWGWSEKRARTFLQNLEKLSMITRKVTQQMTQITICNFTFYQNRGHSKGQIEGEQRANRGRTEGTKKTTISRNHDTTVTVQGDSKKQNPLPSPSANGKIPARKVLLEIWNRHARQVSKASEPFAEERLNKAGARLKKHMSCKCHEDIEDYLHDWEVCCVACNIIPFMRGEGQRGWKASVDWLLKSDLNMDKIFEGKYGPIPYAQIEGIIGGSTRTSDAEAQ